MTKQKNGTWKISNDEMHDIMICFFEGIKGFENDGFKYLAERYERMYSEFCSEDDKNKTK